MNEVVTGKLGTLRKHRRLVEEIQMTLHSFPSYKQERLGKKTLPVMLGNIEIFDLVNHFKFKLKSLTTKLHRSMRNAAVV